MRRPPLGGWFRSTFSAFSVPEYRVLWLGSTVAMLTFMMSWTVQSVVAFELAGTNTAVGIVGLGSGVSMLILGPFGGVFADRTSKRRLLLVGQGMIGLVYLVLAILVLTDRITIMLLVAMTFIMGLSFSMVGPVRQAYVGEIAPPRLLANAVALSSLSQMFSRIVSPTAAGILIGVAVVGPGGTFLIMTVMMLVVLVTIGLLPDVPPRPTEGRSVFRDFREGLAYVLGEPKLRFLAGTFILVVLLGFSFQIILPGLLENELDRPARTVGFMLGVSAVGGFVAGVTLAGLADSRFALPIQLLLGLLFGGSLVALGLAPTFEGALAATFLVGLGSGGFQMLNQSQLMTITAPAYHGRVMSLQMFAWGANGLIALPIGLLADGLGERTVISAMGVGVALVVAVGLLAYRWLVPSSSPRPIEVTVPSEVPAPAPAPRTAARPTVALGVHTSPPRRPIAPAMARAAVLPRRRKGRDFMGGDGVIVGRDYM